MTAFCNYLQVLLRQRLQKSGDLRSSVPTLKLIDHFKKQFGYSLCEDIDTADCASCRQRVMSYIENSRCYCHSPDRIISNKNIVTEAYALCSHCLCRFVATEYIVFPSSYNLSLGFRIYRELMNRTRLALNGINKVYGKRDRPSLSEIENWRSQLALINDTMVYMKFDGDDHLSVKRYVRICKPQETEEESEEPTYLRKRKCWCSECTGDSWWLRREECCKDHFNNEDLSKPCTKCLCQRLNQVAYNDNYGITHDDKM
jgi:hypothetical protein